MKILGALPTNSTDTFRFISHTTNVLLFKFRCNIFIGVRIIKEMPGSVASGTLCITAQGRSLWQESASVLCRKSESVSIIHIYSSLTFIGPCIVIYSYSKTNKMHLLSQIIYSCKTLCIFRTVFPSIIRSSRLHIQQQAYVKQLLLPAASGNELEM